jgi:FkbM family methyltransferase
MSTHRWQDLARKYTPRGLRNWLRNPARTAGYFADRCRYAFHLLPRIRINEQWSLRCHPAARAHFEVFRQDPAQAQELDSFVAYGTPGMQLLDIGAHYGFFALAALHYGGAEARAICVEPSARAASILRINLAANGVSGRAQVITVAVGAEDGQLPMLTTGPAGSDYLLVPTEPRADTVLVQERSLDSLLRETGFAPTHIKMDIEGYEFEVVAASVELLAALKPILFLELHGTALTARKKDPTEVLRNLRRAGYGTFISFGKTVTEAEMEPYSFNCRFVCLP